MHAAYPNLAWQGECFSDLRKTRRREFADDGTQLRFPEVLRETDQKMRDCLVMAAGRGPECIVGRHLIRGAAF
jgi:hypothetical protein